MTTNLTPKKGTIINIHNFIMASLTIEPATPPPPRRTQTAFERLHNGWTEHKIKATLLTESRHKVQIMHTNQSFLLIIRRLQMSLADHGVCCWPPQLAVLLSSAYGYHPSFTSRIIFGKLMPAPVATPVNRTTSVRYFKSAISGLRLRTITFVQSGVTWFQKWHADPVLPAI